MNWQAIVTQIQLATDQPFGLLDVRILAGGDINKAYCLKSSGQSYFVKLNRANLVGMFAAEAAGLAEIAASQTVRVPCPVTHGVADAQAFLVLEHIEFGLGSRGSAKQLGEQLASLHRINHPYFGWHRDNTIGSTPQPNPQTEDWGEFWRTHRLQHQLKLAAQNGYRGNLQSTGEQLCQKLSAFFETYAPQPSLLHGDLWGGNAATDNQGNPIIFDPACYYGDRETDLAMTELFGGFDADFYAAYNASYALDPGYQTRKKLYNLYHILNHLNLFGGGYLRQAEKMILSLLSEIS